jgi:hypothetical protein
MVVVVNSKVVGLAPDGTGFAARGLKKVLVIVDDRVGDPREKATDVKTVKKSTDVKTIIITTDRKEH